MEVYLSLCIPTYGMSEWVFPVLESIYCQTEVPTSEYEVVVADNGNNQGFAKAMEEYQCRFNNLKYKRTDAKLFMNEIESYKLATGTLIKFINHRTLMMPGSLGYLIAFAKDNMNSKPCIYFSNGMLYKKPGVIKCSSFDKFLVELGYYSSWSTGMAIWREEFERLDLSKPFNELFPHTTILFSQTKNKNYLIDNKKLLDEMQVGSKNKGRYDLFYAFAVEYPAIICDLMRAGDISIDTFCIVKDTILENIVKLYWRFVIRKEPSSYDISSFSDSIKVFFSRKQVNRKIVECAINKVLRKMRIRG